MRGEGRGGEGALLEQGDVRASQIPFWLKALNIYRGPKSFASDIVVLPSSSGADRGGGSLENFILIFAVQWKKSQQQMY